GGHRSQDPPWLMEGGKDTWLAAQFDHLVPGGLDPHGLAVTSLHVAHDASFFFILQDPLGDGSAPGTGVKSHGRASARAKRGTARAWCLGTAKFCRWLAGKGRRIRASSRHAPVP